MRPVTLALVAAAVTSLLDIEPAHAYLDPGTGSMILQGLIAAVVGATVVLRAYWAKIKGFLDTMFAGKKQSSAETERGDD